MYDIIKDHPEGLKLNDISTVLGSPTDKGTVVEFHSPNVAVKENIGQFDVTVCRYGDLRSEVKVRSVFLTVSYHYSYKLFNSVYPFLYFF